MKKWGILGWGKSGQAVGRYLQAKNEEFLGIDDFVAGCAKNVDLAEIHTLVVSPGVKMDHPLLAAAKKRGITITSELEIALSLCKEREIPLIGITGSVGKTTTSLLLTHLLQRGGKRAFCLGNVGIPVLSFFLEEKQADMLVLEMSSFQIEKMQPKPLFDHVVILNLYTNHLDHHKNYEAYIRVKLSLMDFLKPQGELMVSKEIFHAHALRGKRVCLYEQEKIARDLVKVYTGAIFPENLMVAAVVAKRWGVTATIEDLNQFVAPLHRLENVAEIRGVSFINDSKATSVVATMRAVHSIKKKIILLAGGLDKGADFTPWIEPFKEKVKMMVVIGEAKEKLAQMCQGHLPVMKACTIQEAVELAFGKAEKDDCILLSPGCASYDQFKSYEERGECFKQAVWKLQGAI